MNINRKILVVNMALRHNSYEYKCEKTFRESGTHTQHININVQRLVVKVTLI